MAVYRNGVEATSGDTSAAFINGEANFHIGGRLGSSFAGAIDDFAISSFAGAIDDFAIFSATSALSSAILGDDEIMALR
jgi:hypothetical protein